MGGNKSVLTAYFLWLTTGLFGFHHLYLNREEQAWLWATSWGGYLVGWVRDLWRIPAYTRDANDDPEFLAILAEQMRFRPKPPLYLTFVLGQWIFGAAWYNVFANAVDVEWAATSHALGIGGAALGVYLVGHVGRRCGSFWAAVAGACVGHCVAAAASEGDPHASLGAFTVLGALIVFNWKREWRREYRAVERQRGCLRKLCRLGGFCAFFYALTISAIYFNGKIETNEGETVRIRDSIDNMLNSPAWKEFKDNVWLLYQQAQQRGWEETWKEIKNSLDLEGESRSYTILGVEEGCEFSEIKKAYRKLAREWHPDKNPGNEEAAQVRFMEIQEAYQKLEKIHKRRSGSGRSSEEDAPAPDDSASSRRAGKKRKSRRSGEF